MNAINDHGFVSIDWGHVHMEADIVPNPAKNMHRCMDQFREALKSRPSPDARRASATAYVKTVIQGSTTLFSYYLGRSQHCTARKKSWNWPDCPRTTKCWLTSAESTNSRMTLLTWRNNIFICLLNDYYIDQLEIVNDGFIWPDWLQREPAVVERDNKCSPPTTHTHPHPTKPTQLHHQHWLHQFISNKHNYDRSSYPNSFQQSLSRNRHKSIWEG